MRAEIAKNLRANAEKYRSATQLFGSRLDGMCAICSWALAEAFRRHGHAAVAVYGLFDGNPHCWVRAGEEVWDITGTQFGSKFPKVHKTTVDDEMYAEYMTVPDLDHSWWNRWPLLQMPSESVTSFLLEEI
jgi:hypothetical protein